MLKKTIFIICTLQSTQIPKKIPSHQKRMYAKFSEKHEEKEWFPLKAVTAFFIPD